MDRSGAHPVLVDDPPDPIWLGISGDALVDDLAHSVAHGSVGQVGMLHGTKRELNFSFQPPTGMNLLCNKRFLLLGRTPHEGMQACKLLQILILVLCSSPSVKQWV